MAWIGQRDTLGGLFNAAGLDQPYKDADPAEHLNRGSVMVEYRHNPSARPLNLVRYMTRDPEPAALTLRSDPCGTLRVMVRSGDADTTYDISLLGPRPDETIIVRLTWDCDAGRSILSATLVERGVHVIEELDEALPFSAVDGRQMMMTARCTLDPCVRFLALADEVIPVGPMAGLDGKGRVKTPEGRLVPISDLRPGQLLLAADGQPAQLRWTGSVQLPTMGSYAPVSLRAPYFGATQDLTMSGGQALFVSGTEVEYLFAEIDVAVRMNDLIDNRSAVAVHKGMLVTYYHLLIDRPVPIEIDGVMVPGLDVRPMLADPLLAAHSMVSGLPFELIPRDGAPSPLALQAFEAQTLCRMRAA